MFCSIISFESGFFFSFVKGFVVVIDLFVFEPSDFYQALIPIFSFLLVLKLIY